MDGLESIQQAVLRALAAHGGRMQVVDLLSEVAPGSGSSEAVRGATRALKGLGLMAGPSSGDISYQLTAAGWRMLATLTPSHPGMHAVRK